MDINLLDLQPWLNSLKTCCLVFQLPFCKPSELCVLNNKSIKLITFFAFHSVLKNKSIKLKCFLLYAYTVFCFTLLFAFLLYIAFCFMLYTVSSWLFDLQRNTVSIPLSSNRATGATGAFVGVGWLNQETSQSMSITKHHIASQSLFSVQWGTPCSALLSSAPKNALLLYLHDGRGEAPPPYHQTTGR